MSVSSRQQALRDVSAASAGPAPRETPGSSLPEHFGSKVFNDEVQRRRLPKTVYKAVRHSLSSGVEMSPQIADAVANAMKDWALEHGATHYTHWFQPMTGATAEKHDAFLSPTLEGGAIQEFSGNDLIIGEPDASSFPSGGVRNTFEARGYTGWDPGSPAFIRETDFGATLTIPTVFVSWTGEALDTKTPLLRSCEAIDKAARTLLGALGEDQIKRVSATVGPEQEYFLVDRRLFHLRPDLLACGRTLLGSRPPKGQELEDHYFGKTPQRVLNFQMDLEQELWQLGVPVKTRHNEVAPHQFESAPVFEAAAVATDHNMLTMEILQEVAVRHGFACLLHEKPFAGVNGSGKHVNWSIATDDGQNLLEPGETPHDNLRFMAFLTAIVRAVDEYQDLLRVTIASAGNDHRLGANEAPPAIISVFLGKELQDVVDNLVSGKAHEPAEDNRMALGVGTLPRLPRHNSDRNRTSPFAFTGAKFEFRAVGSNQSAAFPATVINTIVADSVTRLAAEIEKEGNAIDVLRRVLSDHGRILFSGDNYSDEWKQEAERRGLLNLAHTPAALVRFTDEKNLALFERHGVLSRRETESRAQVLTSAYIERFLVEALSLRNLAATSVMPAGVEFQRRLAESITAVAAALPAADLAPQKELLGRVAELVGELRVSVTALESARDSIESAHGDAARAALAVRENLLPVMERVRLACDCLEEVVDDELWPLPKYRELLFVH
ncbi:3-hydroxylaminophenol mutase [Planctomycetes bacterium Pla163]|uniref:3-hydroxylaminophenol mutase n=1 Tax=Rohdeia mirabilis TaxID=2528008 RepID=A0A518CZ83_9BACT|nr:3-hydroxylaminophenol mutase [Planctomycetes bacterium Pla163]